MADRALRLVHSGRQKRGHLLVGGHAQRVVAKAVGAVDFEALAHDGSHHLGVTTRGSEVQGVIAVLIHFVCAESMEEQLPHHLHTSLWWKLT